MNIYIQRTFQVECPELDVKNVTVYGPKTAFYPVKGKAVSTFICLRGIKAYGIFMQVSCVAISPNGNLFAAGNGDEVSLGSIAEGKSQVIKRKKEGFFKDVKQQKRLIT